jgi:hypothetical protein
MVQRLMVQPGFHVRRVAQGVLTGIQRLDGVYAFVQRELSHRD